jgi:hypothetical protein
MGEDLAEILKMIEKQSEKQTRHLEKQARDSEARLENMIEKCHNNLKGSIDDIKSEVKQVCSLKLSAGLKIL